MTLWYTNATTSLLINFKFPSQIKSVGAVHVEEQFLLNFLNGWHSKHQRMIFQHGIDVQAVDWTNMHLSNGIRSSGNVPRAVIVIVNYQNGRTPQSFVNQFQ